MKLNNLKLTFAALAILSIQTIAEAKGLVMGLIPAENNEEMIQKFEPMRQYLEAKTGEPVFSGFHDPDASDFAIARYSHARLYG